MKEVYVYRDKEIIAADLVEDKGAEVRYDYQDNIEEIMKIENILEYLNGSKEELTKKLSVIETNLNKNKNLTSSYLAVWISFGTVLTVIGVLFGLLGNIWIAAWSFPLLISIVCSAFALYTKNNSRILLKREGGFKLELEKVEEQIKENKTLLETLKNDKSVSETKINELKNKVNYVRYKEKLNELKKYLELYRVIGKNIKTYRKYYRSGVLEEKLENKYEESQIILIKKYLEKKKRLLS